MTHYTSFALAGAGGLGSFIAQHLAAVPGISLRVLSRSADTKVPQGVEIKVVDYDSEKSLIDALEGVQVVISTLNNAGFAAQPALAKAAAKVGGVKLFVPSEFGNPTAHLTDGPLLGKTQFQGLLKSLGLDYLLVHNGPFLDTTFVPFLGFDWENDKVDIIGSGTNPVPLTTQNDVARFLSHILTTSSPSSLANKTLRIQADLISFHSAVKLFEATHHGRKIDITLTSKEDALKVIREDAGLKGLLTWLRLSWDEEQALEEEETDNKLWPEWNPTKAREVLAAV